MKKKVLYGVGGILLLLILTNPSQKAFKEYLGYDSYAGLRRTDNYFLFSLYKYQSRRYFAIALNFFKIEPKIKVPTQADSSAAKIDTSSKMDVSKYEVKDTSGIPPPPKGFTPIDTLPILPKKKWTRPAGDIAVKDEYGIPIKHKHHKKADSLGLQRAYDSLEAKK